MGTLTLEITEEPIIGNAGLMLYRDRDTCKQNFAKQNSELDMKHMPFGKLSVHDLSLQPGVLKNNMHRLRSDSLLDSGTVGMEKATPYWLRIIMQGMLCLCGRLARHARRIVLKVASSGESHVKSLKRWLQRFWANTAADSASHAIPRVPRFRRRLLGKYGRTRRMSRQRREPAAGGYEKKVNRGPRPRP